MNEQELLARLRRRAPTITKIEFVEQACRGQDVLDVGCISHSAEEALSSGEAWLHHRVSAVASSVLGLDFLAEDAARLNDLGYSIVVSDAETFELDRTFDVVLAADLAEHLSNIGAFLARAREHLRPDGLLVLTTPNPFALAHMIHAVTSGRVPVNDEHTAWFDPVVLHEVLHRHGFTVRDVVWLQSPTTGGSRRSAVLDHVAAPLLRIRPILHRNFGIVAGV